MPVFRHDIITIHIQETNGILYVCTANRGINESLIIDGHGCILCGKHQRLSAQLLFRGKHTEKDIQHRNGNCGGAEIALELVVRADLQNTLIQVGGNNIHTIQTVYHNLAWLVYNGQIQALRLPKGIDQLIVCAKYQHTAVFRLTDIQCPFLCHKDAFRI